MTTPRCDRRTLLGALAGLVLAGRAPRAAGLSPTLRFGAGEFEGDRRYDYALDLLATLLGDVPGSPRLVPVYGMNQRRTRRALHDGGLDLAILPSLGLAAEALPRIPYPIRRGLLGARLIVAREDDVARFERITRIAELKQLTMALAHDWVETPVLAGLGFKHVEGSYRNLFDLVRARRVDYTHRAVSEVWLEALDPELAGRGLAVVPGLALSYPIDDYLVGSRASFDLLGQLAAALRRALASGTYWNVFARHYGDALAGTAIGTRRVLAVTGFGVDEGTPLDLFDVLDLSPQEGRFRVPDEPPPLESLAPVVGEAR